MIDYVVPFVYVSIINFLGENILCVPIVETQLVVTVLCGHFTFNWPNKTLFQVASPNRFFIVTTIWCWQLICRYGAVFHYLAIWSFVRYQPQFHLNFQQLRNVLVSLDFLALGLAQIVVVIMVALNSVDYQLHLMAQPLDCVVVDHCFERHFCRAFDDLPD